MPDFPARVLGGPDPVPEHLRDHRRPVILDEDDVQAVVEREAVDAGFTRQACGRTKVELQQDEGSQSVAHARGHLPIERSYPAATLAA